MQENRLPLPKIAQEERSLGAKREYWGGKWMMNMAGLLRKGGVAGVMMAAGLLVFGNPANAVERQFLGIRMLSKVQTVLARFGNPTQVTVGQVAYNLPGQQVGMAGLAGMPGRAGVAGAPGVPGVPGIAGLTGTGGVPGVPPYGAYGGMPPMGGPGPVMGGAMPSGAPGMMAGGTFTPRPGMAGGGMAGGFRGDYAEDMPPMGMGGGPMFGAPPTGAPGLPGLPGGLGAPMRPGMPPMPGVPGAPAVAGTTGLGGMPGGVGLPSIGLRTTPGGTMLEQETTLIYERPGGVIYEFLVNKDGYVVQAKAIGYEDRSGLARTSRGIKLGDTYQRVVAVYGWPKEHQNLGATLFVRYPNHHVAFQFYDNKVVSIIVAAMEQ
jgi:hypothetical protein